MVDCLVASSFDIISAARNLNLWLLALCTPLTPSLLQPPPAPASILALQLTIRHVNYNYLLCSVARSSFAAAAGVGGGSGGGIADGLPATQGTRQDVSVHRRPTRNQYLYSPPRRRLLFGQIVRLVRRRILRKLAAD